MIPGLGLRSPAFLGALSAIVALEDTFDRADSTDLGKTPIGNRKWVKLRGDWDIYNNQLRNLSGTEPAAVVDARTPDVDISLDVASTGRDAIVFRASDENNWWRLQNYYNSSTSYITEYEWRQTYSHSLYVCASHYDNTSSGPTMNYAATGWGSYSTPPSFPDCYGGSSHNHDTSNPDTGIYSHDHQWAKSGSPTKTGNTRTVSGGTTYTRRVYLYKMEAGSLTQVAYYNTSTTSRLRVVANGSTIDLYSGSGTTKEATRTETFQQDATMHGAGRGSIGSSGSAIDNFVLAPL